jgi:fatty-acyl-CoA synthase
VESPESGDAEVSARIKTEVSDAVYAAFGVAPRLVSVLPPRSLPKTPSGKPRRSATIGLIQHELGHSGSAHTTPLQDTVGS